MPDFKITLLPPPQPEYTPEDVLETALRKIRSGERVCTRCVVVYLDDRNENYRVGYAANDMRASEMLALLRVAEDHILDSMRGPPDA